MTLPFITVTKVLAIMDPLSCDNAIYEDVKVKSSSGETFEVHENMCYGEVTNTANENKHEEKHYYNCHSKVIIIAFVIVFSLLLGTAGACVAFALQIGTLKSEINTLQMASSLQGSFRESLEHLEEVVNQLNLSDNCNLLCQILNQHNVTSSYQQLRQEYTALDYRTQQLNTSTQFLFDDWNDFKTSASGHFPFYPAASCAALPPSSSPSGYYWVMASNGSAVSVYCNMTLSCGGVTGGWIRVAELDMTNSSHQCPSGLRQRTDSGKRTCAPYSNNCSSTSFSVETLSYSSVCGRIIGYQDSAIDAFNFKTRYTNLSIDDNYLDGVSLTHGSPRQHIWTFAAAIDEVGSYPGSLCTCTNTNLASLATTPRRFVGDDYFCDTGSETHHRARFYIEDPLWDGAGCGPLNTCCTFNNPPWFYKQLPQPTTDDIEVRVCRDEATTNEDIAVEIIEILVQ